jgi:hypothetical protein
MMKHTPSVSGPLVLVAGLLALAAAPGCHDSRVQVPDGKDAAAPHAPAGTDSAAAPSLDPADSAAAMDVLTLPGQDASGDAGDTAAAQPPVCQEESHRAQPLPLDVLLLLDHSGSMNDFIAGAGRKWDLVRQAIFAFIGSPPTPGGMGVGLQLVPNVTPALTCTANADCQTAGRSGVCHPEKICVLDGRPVSTFLPCDPGGCPNGGTCQRRGVCVRSARDCFDVGAACPGGAADDLCMMRPRTCGTQMACDGPSYATPVVPIAALPGVVPALTERLRLTDVMGSTPLGSGVQGALTHLAAHLAAHPDRRAVLVLATDGLPTECGPGVSAIRDMLTTAHAATPAITSYVIGVTGEKDGAGSAGALGMLAGAGGSGMPFLLEPDAKLSERLVAALEQIRAAALPCVFDIPPAQSGAVDYDKVNVGFTSGGGVAENVPYVDRPERCDATRGGWYYEREPGPGRRVVVCEASCRRFKADPAAKVDLRFGCKTRVIE